MAFKVDFQRSIKHLALASCSLAALCSIPTLGHAATAAAPTPAASTSVTASAAGGVKPMYGNLSPFYGNLSPFYGNLSPFYGNLSPFYGNLSPFWGNLSPFYGNLSPFYGNLSPFAATTNTAQLAFYGTGTDPFWGGGEANPYTNNPSHYVQFSQIGGFWNTEAANWQEVQEAWRVADSANDYQNLAAKIQKTIIDPASTFWGAAVIHGTKTQDAAASSFVSALTKAGVTFTNGAIDPASLAALTPTDRAMLFLNFYDTLMNYSGTGHVDWWMGATGWSPALAAIAGTSSKTPVVVGMLDFTVAGAQNHGQGSVLQFNSSSTSNVSNGHGTAVESLIAGSIDGSNIMGVAPQGSINVVVYNPYDATNTTNWTDVGKGIDTLATTSYFYKGSYGHASVINASLGQPGSTLSEGWNTALASGLARNLALVVAAGNEGVTQSTDVAWNFAKNPTLLVVGSVGVDGTISNFSNRPGEACLLDTANGACDKLKNHFIVAPGELILVGDGAGGFSRQSGTSLAAPLVSGAIALLQTRWPWLANYAPETAQIILKSATPKGVNPGADAVYGVGELNIAASQAPLNWNALQYYSVTNGVKSASPISVASVVSQVKGGTQASFNASGLYFTALETVGRTQRDFQIPLSASLVGQSVTTNGGSQLFQSYLATSLKSWVAAGAHFASDTPSTFALGFSEQGAPVGKVGGMALHMQMAPHELAFGYKPGNVTADTDVSLVGGGQALRFGYGQGAAALAGGAGLNERADYDPQRGGANPLLGLASGGAFADWRLAVTPRLAISAGVTQRHDVRDLSQFGVGNLTSAAGTYAAAAQHFGLDYAASDDLVIHSGLTMLHEDTALLGVQSLASGALHKGSTTTGATLGFDLALRGNLMLSGSGTVARTTTPSGQGFSTSAGGLISSAGELALTKSGVFTSQDRLRLTVSKTMQVDSGQLRYSSYGVVDRTTGQLGIINQSVDPSKSTVPVAVEMLYGRLLPKQAAEVSLFMRAGSNSADASAGRSMDYVVGGKYRLSF
jgi:hypothetical protein